MNEPLLSKKGKMKKKIVRSDWSGTKPGEKMGDGILKTGTFKGMEMKKVYCKDCRWRGNKRERGDFCLAGNIVLKGACVCEKYKRKWWKVWVR